MTSTQPKPFVFVLMPFDDKFGDVYELGIKPACAEAGAYAERVDEQIFQESILQRIYNQIAKADVIVADMTGRNPNVFYETGYAHALGKQVILLTQHADDIPFDLKHYPHIIYGGTIRDLKPKLKKRVRWAVTNAGRDLSSVYPNLEFYIDGKTLLGAPTIDYFIKTYVTKSIKLKIDAHNPIDRRIEPQKFKVGFITSAKFYLGRVDHPVYANTVKFPDGNLIHLLDITFELVPGGWESVFIELLSRERMEGTRKTIENVVLRVFTYSGVVDYPFSLRVVRSTKD